MVGECPERRGGTCAKGTGAAQPLGRGDVLTPTAIGGVKGEEVGRLGDHLLAPFGGACGVSMRSMNLACSKLIEHNPTMSSENCEKALSCW
jgi:hypothetical protein